jgi:hypothetical protein
MAEFQWWLLIVGVVAGGGLVAVVTMDGRRREEDIGALERRAETSWITGRLARRDGQVDSGTIEAVLRLHREYLGLPPPDRLVVADDDGSVDLAAEGWAPLEPEARRKPALDRDPDHPTDEVRDDGGGAADEDLASAGVEHAAAGEQAHPRADREERADR